ncbi:MAG: DUF1232 domain-containing protein [Deltaproteobacteria bacterium]|nr:DUF1232 domain-containing protein [Deltaproteobacteria bacterium]
MHAPDELSLARRLRALAATFKRELRVYRLVLKDPRTPRLAKILLGLAIGYVLLPFDLIPDFIPVLGHLDELVIVPGLVFLALKLIPADVVAACRRQAEEEEESEK